MDIKQVITDRIIERLEAADLGDFEIPFAGAGKDYNVISNKAYRGINTLVLSFAPYASPVWGTYKQWAGLGAQVQKGEKSTHIVFFKSITKENEAGENDSYMMARGYSVFNSEQVDGWDSPAIDTPSNPVDQIAVADQFFSALNIETREAPGRAFYSPATDFVSLPPRSDFTATSTSTATENYYSTSAHEYTHATGHKSRLDRQFGGRFGNPEYAAEELVAEIGAAMIMSQLNLTGAVRDDHVKYIKSWLGALKNDKQFIFTAASKSQAALDWMITQQKAEIAIAA
jgi:antirestriction protein ArdC